MEPKNKNYKFKVYLGTLKGEATRVYLEGFSWDCDWYWGGGGISTRNSWSHFDGCFLNTIDTRGHALGNFVDPWYKGRCPDTAVEIRNGCSIWENLETFLDDAQYTESEWWRIKDLYKQFYIHRKSAEAFRVGGHCTSTRSKNEINLKLADTINKHIEENIIPEIITALKVTIKDI